MSCFFSAATPSRFNCCTGVNLLFLGSGIRSCWAWAANPPHNRDKARTEGVSTVANGERMSFQILVLRPLTPHSTLFPSHRGRQGRSSTCLLDGKTLSQVGLARFALACHL